MVMHFSILVCRDLFLKEGLPGHKQACFSPLIPPYTAVLRLTYVLSNSRHTHEMHVAAILCFFSTIIYLLRILNFLVSFLWHNCTTGKIFGQI